MKYLRLTSKESTSYTNDCIFAKDKISRVSPLYDYEYTAPTFTKDPGGKTFTELTKAQYNLVLKGSVVLCGSNEYHVKETPYQIYELLKD